DDEGRAHVDQVVAPLELVYDDRDGVRDLLAQDRERLLANDLRQTNLDGLVGHLARWVQRGALRQASHQEVEQEPDPSAGLCRDRNDLVELAQLGRPGELGDLSTAPRASTLFTAQIFGHGCGATCRSNT